MATSAQLLVHTPGPEDGIYTQAAAQIRSWAGAAFVAFCAIHIILNRDCIERAKSKIDK
ncbi:MAG: hypothetical protein GXN93_02230 [Candidatus Diapherotrites archaeon]|nr:hypothetical protein [Candidatus Diapherotrites archaeon]